MSKLKKKYEELSIKYDVSHKSNVERVKDLLKAYNIVTRSPLNEDTAIRFEQVLKGLNQYVTLIGFTENGEYGEVDIELSVQALKNNIERLSKT